MVYLVTRLLGCFNRMQILLLYWLMMMHKIEICKTHRFPLSSPKCQPITVEQCKDLPYNET
ncbi:unnamed protein product, partial [Wuchereria bancrofti]